MRSEAMSQDEEMLTTDEVAKILRVNVKTVRNWIASGELVAIDIGNEYRISRKNLNDFMQRRQTDKRRKE
jgi:excisionase family DNA binding protein